MLLIKLASTLVYNNVTQPTCLPNSTFGTGTTYPQDEIESWAAGWGAIAQNGSTSDVLLNVKLMIYNSTVCNNFNPDLNRQICAGYYPGGKDTCQGLHKL